MRTVAGSKLLPPFFTYGTSASVVLCCSLLKKAVQPIFGDARTAEIPVSRLPWNTKSEHSGAGFAGSSSLGNRPKFENCKFDKVFEDSLTSKIYIVV
jgi:hypothetical protein